MLLIFTWAYWAARDWPWQARQLPSVICIITAMLCLYQVWLDLFGRKQDASKEEGWIFDLTLKQGIPLSVVVRRIVNIFAWIFGFFFSLWIFGFIISVPLFTLLYLIVQGREKVWVSLLYTAVVQTFLLGMFHYVIHIAWTEGLINWPQEMILKWLGS
jgi:hypothetical protein